MNNLTTTKRPYPLHPPRRLKERTPTKSEHCSCGRPAIIVYYTEKFGEVPYCGIPDGGAKRGEASAEQLECRK